MNVLIVDDEVIIRNVLQEALVGFNHNVTTAVDGRDALTIIQQNTNNFDVIVTDLKMPYINGMELCNELKQSGNEIPVILMTGHAHIDHDCKDFLGVLYKPFALNELTDLISKVKIGVI